MHAPLLRDPSLGLNSGSAEFHQELGTWQQFESAEPAECVGVSADDADDARPTADDGRSGGFPEPWRLEWRWPSRSGEWR